MSSPIPIMCCAAVLTAVMGCRGVVGDVAGAGNGATTGRQPSVGGTGVSVDKLPPGSAGPINPGRVVAHRLNRVEYDNTIRDLIGVDLKPSGQFGFPDDNYIEGFDNNADSLSSSPLLLEKYQAATDAIVARALDSAPSNAAVRSRIMVCDPATTKPAACAAKILAAFAIRAFRRPVTDPEVASYAALLDTAARLGDGFEQGIQAGLKAILLSPKFLFRVEANPGPGNVAPISDHELASRLSYFIWSSMPDSELLQKADGHGLHLPDEIKRQVARMVQDPKAASLVENLSGEWLGSRELVVKEITLADVQFDAALRDAMAQEPALFLRELIVGDHTVEDLLGGNFAFVNQRLAQHYGLSNASSVGAAFQKIDSVDDVRAGGVLTQANFLTVQSQRDRTSPTRRGKWISENLLCVAVPPPPPKIPELSTNDQTKPTSTRQRLEQHRQRGAACNGCHQYIDPLGLAFEHYDPVGRWRGTDLGAAIDTTGEIPSTAVAFDGAVNLAGALKKDARFSTCVIRKFFTYSLGRSLNLEPQPGDAIDDVAGIADVKTRVLAGGGRLALLVEAIAQSPLMTMRIGEE